MVVLDDLLAAPAIRSLLTPLTETSSGREVTAIHVIESIDGLGDIPPNAIGVLGRGASADVASYRFDIGLRLAADSGVAAVILTGVELDELSPSARAIAEKARMSIVVAAPAWDLSSALIALHRELSGDADVALHRASMALNAVRKSEIQKLSPEDLVAEASAALGLEMQIREREEGEPSAPVIVDGSARSFVVGPHVTDSSTEACLSLTLEIVAAAASRLLAERRRAEELPALSRAQLLGELLQSPPGRETALRERARADGVPLDGWHTVLHIEFENLLQVSGDEEASAFELSQALKALALQGARQTGGIWQDAYVGQALVLIRMDRTDPGPRAGAAITTAAEHVIRRLRSRLPELMLHCGVGSAHAGAAGLLASAAEGRTALAAARTSGRVNTAVAFDTVGMRRMVIEWYSLDSARETVRTLLAPLDELGQHRSEVAVRTLAAYLDNQGSLSRTAKALHAHRNTVAYRVKKIFELLDIDSEDPDERLLLHLACRARSLPTSPLAGRREST